GRASGQALGDQPGTPRFIGTVHGRGYRFLATVSVADPPPETGETALLRRLPPPAARVAPPRARLRPGLLVGREAEFAQVQQWWAHALRGGRPVGVGAGGARIGHNAPRDAV